MLAQSAVAQAATVKKCVSSPDAKGIRLTQDPNVFGGCPLVDPSGLTWSLQDIDSSTIAGGGSSVGSTIGFYVAQIIYVFTVGLGSILAYVGAFLLNIAISFSLDSSAYNLDFISTGWTTLRDIANMAFIFILVYIAIQVMFQAQTHGTLERLVKVLAVALIINFSFFATRVVIDAGNLVSVQFYNAITADAPTADANLVAVANSGLHVPDITAKIMQGVNFQSAISTDSFKNAGGNDVTDFGSTFISFAFIYIALGAMLFMLAAAFIAAGVKFLVRIVMLWFAIITAPLALVAWSFQGGGGHGGHGGGGYFGRWLKNLFNHAFYPAVFLFVMLLISNFMGGKGDFGGGYIQQSINSLQGNTGGIPGLAAIVANIAVRLGFVLVMLYFALKSSDYLEVAGANFAKSMGNNFAFGLPAWLGRKGIGGTSFAIANNLSDNSRFKAPLNLLARSSFDVRNAKVPLAKKVTGKDFGLAKQADKLGFGKSGNKGGYVGDVERKAKEIANEANHHREGMLSEAMEASKIYREHGGPEGVKEELRGIQSEIVRLEIQEKELAKKDRAKMTEAEGKAHDSALAIIRSQKETAQKQFDRLNNIQETAKQIVKDRNDHHTQHAYEALISSNSVAKQLAARRLKMTKDERKDEKEAEKEHAEHEKHESSGGGGGEKKGGGGGGGDHH